MRFRHSPRYASPYPAATILRDTATIVAVGYNSTRALQENGLVVGSARLARFAHEIFVRNLSQSPVRLRERCF